MIIMITIIHIVLRNKNMSMVNKKGRDADGVLKDVSVITRRN